MGRPRLGGVEGLTPVSEEERNEAPPWTAEELAEARNLLARADRIYLTRVHASVAADTFLPRVDPDEWRERWRESHAADERNPHAYSFILLERRSAGAA
jgi:hypothetical protein